MWMYCLALAWRNSRRTRGLTVLIVLLLVAGVSSCALCLSMFAASAADPLPGRSAQLYVPEVDALGPAELMAGAGPISGLTYIDALALWQSHMAPTALVYVTHWSLAPTERDRPAPALQGDAVTSEFFSMFAVSFAYGGEWSRADDQQHAAVAVISAALNQKLFGGVNSVGRVIVLDGKPLQIRGVIGDWHPHPRFFDIDGIGPLNAFEDEDGIYVPFSYAIDQHKSSRYDTCPATTAAATTANWAGYLRSACSWIDAWVVLPTPADVQRYRQFLFNYASEQQKVGRFAWAANVDLLGLMDWLDSVHVRPRSTQLALLVSFGFLFIAVINVTGLMLARFMRRSAEIGVRRALGASRWHIYQQLLTEALLIGVIGGGLSLLATWLAFACADQLFEGAIARLVHMNAQLMAVIVGIAMSCALLAGLFPAWRAARTAPAWQIRING